MDDYKEFLTQEELQQLTGYKSPSKQCEWLDNHGWTFVSNAIGETIVARCHFRTKLNPPPILPTAGQEPDWSMLDD